MVDQDASFYLMVVVAMSDHEIHEKEAVAIKEISDKLLSAINENIVAGYRV